VDDDTGILIFLGVGVLVLIGIIVFGVLSSRRKRAATRHTFTVRQASIDDQPFLESSDLDASDTRQEELFRAAYPLGGSLVLAWTGADGDRIEQEVHVSRIARSLRAGWPQAKLGLSVYFREWEGSEFPARFAVKGTDKVANVEFDATGVRAVDGTEDLVWSAPWEKLLFSNGTDIMLSDGAGRTIRVEPRADEPELEEILIKYGTMKQMHF